MPNEREIVAKYRKFSKKRLREELKKKDDHLADWGNINNDKNNALRLATGDIHRLKEQLGEAERRNSETQRQLDQANQIAEGLRSNRIVLQGRLDDALEVIRGVREWIRSTDTDLQEVFDEAADTLSELLPSESDLDLSDEDLEGVASVARWMAEDNPTPSAVIPLVREVDPELERIIAEEEEIERRTRERNQG